MNSAKISVIIPIYNMSKHLEECLDSILVQTLKDIEIICINDGSTDSSQEILQRYKKEHGNIVIVYQENQGPGSARNVAIDLALGEYIAFMDADDYYPKNDVLEKLYFCAKQNNVAICGGSLVLEREGQYIKKEDSLRGGYSFKHECLVDYRDYQFVFGYTRFIYQTVLLRKYQIKFPAYRGFEDPPFMAKAMIYAKTFYAMSKNVYVYRGTDKIALYDKFDIVNDIAKGLDDILKISLEGHFQNLHGDMAISIFDIYIYSFYKSVYKGNKKMIRLLENLKQHISDELLEEDGRITERHSIMSENEIILYIENFKRKEMALWCKIKRFSNIVIYGAGKMGRKLCDYIQKKNYMGTIEFAVSYQWPKGTACGKIIRNIEQYLPKSSDILVLVAVKGDDAQVMMNKAKEIGFANVERVEYEEVQLLGVYE